MKVLGVIPARGGSKGIPRKNLAPLRGRPLLAYTAEAALAAKRLARVVLSTEDDEIARTGRRLGLDVPFLRPRALARDDTPMLPVVQDAVRRLEEAGERYDAVCLLQPTAPLRRPADIDRCIDLLERTGADAAVTIVAVPPEHNPHWVYFQDESGCLRLSTGEREPVPRRQNLPPAYHRDGSVYVTRRDVLMIEGSLYGTRLAGCLMDASRAANIDTEADLARAELLFERS